MTCSICGGTGLLPFVKPNGTISKHAKVFCDCHPVYGTNAHTSIPLATQGNRPGIGSRTYKQQRGRLHLYPDDFDFPMSYSVYRSLCQQYGWQDPGPDRPPEQEQKPQVVEHIVRHSNLGAKEFDLLQQTALKVQYLDEKLTEVLAKRKPRGKY